jgi:Short C-terminal domain
MSPFGLHRSEHSETSAPTVAGEALVLTGDSGFSGMTSWLSLTDLLVTVPGQAPVKVSHECMVDRDKELIAGLTVPVDVNPADLAQLTIRWADVPTIDERVANRDPLVFDPESSWRTVEETWHALVPQRPVQPTPWGGGRVDGWPPGQPLPGGRQPGTAWVISDSEDAEYFRGAPMGRTHYQYKGELSYGPHRYLTWLLLLIIPQRGERYGLRMRTEVVRWRFSPVLPVSLDPDAPADIQFCWDDAANVAHLITDELDAGVNLMQDRIAMLHKLTEAAPVTPPATPASPLERLEQMHASGVLTDAEFASERARLGSSQ